MRPARFPPAAVMRESCIRLRIEVLYERAGDDGNLFAAADDFGMDVARRKHDVTIDRQQDAADLRLRNSMIGSAVHRYVFAAAGDVVEHVGRTEPALQLDVAAAGECELTGHINDEERGALC